MIAPAVFAFGLVAFGFLGMGPVTIAVDSYGPVADNANRCLNYRPSPPSRMLAAEIKEGFRLRSRFRKGQAFPGRERRRGQHIQGHGQAGADRHRRRRRDDADFLDHHVADRRLDECGRQQQFIAVASAIPVGSDHGRRRDLLVYRRVDAGSRYRGLSSCRIHQGEHPTR